MSTPAWLRDSPNMPVPEFGGPCTPGSPDRRALDPAVEPNPAPQARSPAGHPVDPDAGSSTPRRLAGQADPDCSALARIVHRSETPAAKSGSKCRSVAGPDRQKRRPVCVVRPPPEPVISVTAPAAPHGGHGLRSDDRDGAHCGNLADHSRACSAGSHHGRTQRHRSAPSVPARL